MSIRRVATGETADGESQLVSDVLVRPVELKGIAEVAVLWGADSPPNFPVNGENPPRKTYYPPPGGYRFVVLTLQPRQTSSAPGPEALAPAGLAPIHRGRQHDLHHRLDPDVVHDRRCGGGQSGQDRTTVRGPPLRGLGVHGKARIGRRTVLCRTNLGAGRLPDSRQAWAYGPPYPGAAGLDLHTDLRRPLAHGLRLPPLL